MADSTVEDANRPRRILFVCTANICRSPTAELLARDRFGEQTMVFRSAGVLRSGVEVPDDLTGVLAKREIDATLHRSSQLDVDTVAAADLILTMEGRHVQEITIQFPDAFNKTLPLREAAERLRGPVTLSEFMESLANRDPAAYLSSRWDVDDPYKRGRRRYRKMVEQVDGLLETVLQNLR